MSTTISVESPLKGGCYCGAVSYAISAPPVTRAFCHCTQCQRLNACPFIHTIHVDALHFTWAHATPHESFLDGFVNPSRPWKQRFRCKSCGCTIASKNSKTNRVSVWGAQLERDDEGKVKRWDEVKPTAHIFYATRMLDIDDGLGKWEGYEGKSKELL